MNVVCKKSHITVNSRLAKCISLNQRDWTNHAQQVEFCFNASFQEAARHTLFFLIHDTEPRQEVDLHKNDDFERTAYFVNKYADFLVTRLENFQEVVREYLGVVAWRMSDWYDKKAMRCSSITCASN